MLLLLLRSLFHAFQQPGEIIEVAGINFQVKQITVTVKQFIRWESVNTKMALDGGLLLWGQIVVSYIRATHIILLDDVLPRRLRAFVGQIEILDIIVLQTGVFLGRVTQCFFAGAAPRAPDVEQHKLALIRFENLL